MVKGITRQVILVKSPDPRLFEEAIFIVKEEALAREGVSADKVLREARQRRQGDDDCSAICLYLPPQDRGKREV